MIHTKMYCKFMKKNVGATEKYVEITSGWPFINNFTQKCTH